MYRNTESMVQAPTQRIALSSVCVHAPGMQGVSCDSNQIVFRALVIACDAKMANVSKLGARPKTSVGFALQPSW